MPFRTHRILIQLCRKEKDSFIAQQIQSQTLSERVSGFTSKASITVEASLVVCLFFFALLTFLSLFEMMFLQAKIQGALCSVGKQMAVESSIQPMIFTAKMEERLVETIGEEILENSMIRGGASGLNCSASKSYFATTIMELVVEYELEVPIFLFRIPILSQKESIRIKGWSGKEGLGLGIGSEQMVYMTEHGIVYHADMSCTYLELSIHPVLKSEITGYRPCSYCSRLAKEQEMVYVTTYGEVYHSTLDCRGLRRKVYVVPLSEVYGIGGCSKCVD